VVPPDLQPAWRAPAARQPIHAAIDLPASKSLSNRALLLASIADGPSTLRGLLEARDTALMTDALRALGTTIHTGQGVMRIEPAPLRGPAEIECGLAGNVMRFVPAIAGLAVGHIGFDGDARARRRPLSALLTALRDLGVAVTRGAHALPFSIAGSGSVPGGRVELDSAASSQFISALLLAGPRYDNGVDIVHAGDAVPSQPHIDMTIAMLHDRGVSVEHPTDHRWHVAPAPIAAVDETIEPDLSNAAPFLAAAAVTAGAVTVRRWPEHTNQPGDYFPRILGCFGARVVRSAEGLTVEGTGQLHGIDIDLHDHGELTPAVTALAALADSPSRIRGIAHLRGHESDRIAALAHELRQLGCRVRETTDGLAIDSPAKRPGPIFRTYDDHRMAHTAAIIGLRIAPLLVDDVATTTKTFPGFANAWESLVNGDDRSDTSHEMSRSGPRRPGYTPR
jgi:3-phosphoshikimate 1-carboxyvinyltransferase